MECKIKKIKAYEILDSKGKPTVRVDLKTNFGIFSASVPSGVSRGKYEAIELRDEKGGVSPAIKNIEKILAPALLKKDVRDQQEIDNIMRELDGTEDKIKLGANALLPISLAVCRAGAKAYGLFLFEYISKLAKEKPSLPKPSVLLIEGGLHGENRLDFQEFMIVPFENSFKKNFQKAKEIHKKLGLFLNKKYKNKKMGYEGGFAAPLEKVEEVLELINKIAGRKNIKIAIDVAASSFYSRKKYNLEEKRISRNELLKFYLKLIEKYPILSLEDPFYEEDWQGFQTIMRQIKTKRGRKVIIFGDDLLATDLKRIKEAERKKACNGLILKPNQVGTLTEAIEAGKLAKSFGWKIMVSHRAGETKDDFIADLAVGIGADFIKSGGPTKPERKVKYERLSKIENFLRQNK